MNRREFAKGCASVASLAAIREVAAQNHASTGVAELELRQKEIDAITPAVFVPYWRSGLELTAESLSASVERFPVLGRLEAAFEKVFREVKDTVVTDIDRPAVWYLYNMGIVVKTPRTLFSVDLHHRRAEEFAPLLDFAMITHNHNDHYTERFKYAMDRVQRKPVVNNFFDNYGVRNRKLGGYTRAKTKTLRYGDVEVVTLACDHNSYLIDYTTAFEVHIGGFTILHSGDCCSYAKLRVSRRPDLWVFHPYCGMDVVKGCAEAIRPKQAVIAHLQEMGHAKGRYRWTYRDGLDVKARIESAGLTAKMPLWGERIA